MLLSASWVVNDVLAFDNVGRVFRSGACVSELTFTVEPGEIVALIGLNGAGKTTLMRLALGMLRPQQGAVRVLGQPLDELPVESWRQVGALQHAPRLVVLDEPSNALDPASVTTLPSNWSALRETWETAHAVAAGLSAVAFLAFVLVLLATAYPLKREVRTP